MNDLVHYIQGKSAVNIAESVENALREGNAHSGDLLPPVRQLARKLRISPATAASAYQMLQSRGVVIAQGRRGTRISHRPIHRCRSKPCVPKNARNLYDGNPDPALLPDMSRALESINAKPRLYGESLNDSDFVKLVARDMKKCGVSVGEMCVVSGAMDGMERVLSEYTKPGDRVIVEDPGFGNIYDLVMSKGLSLLPVAMDDEGILPNELAWACEQGAKAMIVAPRAQNPTGSIYSKERAEELRKILKRWPDVLIIEDDHASLIVDAPLYGLHDESSQRWVYVKSFSKALNPDLRLAVMTGDTQTMTRVLDRLIVGERWVSHILQRIAYVLLSDSVVRKQLRQAALTYSRRRNALVEGLVQAGFHATGASGYNVWMEVEEEVGMVQSLQKAGWAVSAGERFRLDSRPGIRITSATLEPVDAQKLVDDLARITDRNLRTAYA